MVSTNGHEKSTASISWIRKFIERENIFLVMRLLAFKALSTRSWHFPCLTASQEFSS